MNKETDSPVICAECRDTGRITRLSDGNHLTCALMDERPIWGSKPKWCPKEHSNDHRSRQSTGGGTQ